MCRVHESALEHLQSTERTCVLRYLAVLCDRLGPSLLEVHLFGSFARGDAWGPNSPMRSDIDLLVLCSEQPSDEDINHLVAATYPLFLECGRQLSPQFRTRNALDSPTTDRGRAFRAQFRDEGRLLFAAQEGTNRA